MANPKSSAKKQGEQHGGAAKVTTDHHVIRKWAEERGGCPTSVEGTAPDHQPGLLRLDFKPKDDKLEDIDWDAFFEKFEAANLAFLYQERTADGHVSRFHKFVDRSNAEGRE